MYGLPPESKNFDVQTPHFCIVNTTKPLDNMHTRGLNVNVKRRIRQIIVLVFTIIMGVLISQATQAEGTQTKSVSSFSSK
jgi:hypothetical protein